MKKAFGFLTLLMVLAPAAFAQEHYAGHAEDRTVVQIDHGLTGTLAEISLTS